MEYLDDDVLVCRCEEITAGEIRQAVREGAKDVVGVKRRVRAGMGLCQGKTCEKMVQQIICQELNCSPKETGYSSYRAPIKPITFASLAKGEFEDVLEIETFEQLKTEMGRE